MGSTGTISFRVQRFRPATNAGFRKGTFELEVGVENKGGFTPLFSIADCALLESSSQELYVAGPSRPMIQRKPDSDDYTILQGDDGKGRYLQILNFARTPGEGEGAKSKLTDEAYAIKQQINDLAIAAYRGASRETAGRGSRVTAGAAKPAPVGAGRAVESNAPGLPGDLEDDEDELPF
jgi:hypothetical protein